VVVTVTVTVLISNSIPNSISITGWAQLEFQLVTFSTTPWLYETYCMVGPYLHPHQPSGRSVCFYIYSLNANSIVPAKSFYIIIFGLIMQCDHEKFYWIQFIAVTFNLQKCYNILQGVPRYCSLLP
jgi:hypothetical protein